MQESARFNAVIVVVKVAVVVLFIAIGYFFINRANYHPFIPPNTGKFGAFRMERRGARRGADFFRLHRVRRGVDGGARDAQSQARHADRDLGSLGICTLLYILYGFVLTGLVNYKNLNVAAPLAVAVKQFPHGYAFMGFVLKVGSLLGLTSVVLVMLLGQSRVFYSMSRDGLMPKLFSDLHPTFRTPWKSNLALMVFAGLLGSYVPIDNLGEHHQHWDALCVCRWCARGSSSCGAPGRICRGHSARRWFRRCRSWEWW